jgi:hypothetical protein
MALTRPRRLTPASLAARRANALKSTGPRTIRGKARVGFNALKLGRHAARSARLRERLIRAGYDRQEALYGQIRSRIAQAFGTPTAEARSRCDALATEVWCLATRPEALEARLRTKPKNYRKQTGLDLRASSHQQIGTEASGAGVQGSGADSQGTGIGDQGLGAPRLYFVIRDPWQRIGLRFWVQRRRYWTLTRLRQMLSGADVGAGLVPAQAGRPQGVPLQAATANRTPASGRRLERAVRSRVFRLAKPGAIERYHYSLMPNGEPDWDREPWKTALARQPGLAGVSRRAGDLPAGYGIK